MAVRALLVTMLLALAPSILHAQDASAEDAEAERCMDFGADDAEVTARIADVRARIGQHEPDTRHWWTAWSTIFGALTGVELTLALTASEDGPRIDAIVSTISLVLGLATQLIAFPPLMGAGGQIDAMPESNADERVRKLMVAETMLRRSAEAVQFSRGPIGPILSGLYSVAANTVLIVAFGRTTGAYIGVLGGVVIGQGRIVTQPYGIVREWRTYRAAYADAGCAAPLALPTAAVDARFAPSVSTTGGGVSFSLTF